MDPNATSGGHDSLASAPPGSLAVSDVLIDGRYQLLELLGHGATSSVYRARDESLGREIALKLFAPQLGTSDDMKRYRAEVELLARLSHPGLVPLFDAGVRAETDGSQRPFLTMELVRGIDLHSRLRAGTLPFLEVAGLGAELCSALAYVHGLGIIHRDVKPANVLLAQTNEPSPRPKLADFGIARVLEGTRLTATGATIGTAAYLSPEQATGSALGPPSDIYSLGLVLLQCLTGHLEYPGSAVESAVARLHRVPHLPPELGAAWIEILRDMTALEPAHRPLAEDLAQRFRRIAAAETTDATTALTTTARPTAPMLPAGPTAQITVTGRETGASQDEPPPRRQHGLRSRVVLLWCAGAVVFLSAAIVLAGFILHPASSPGSPSPSYPAVSGTLGDHLGQLQRSVRP